MVAAWGALIASAAAASTSTAPKLCPCQKMGTPGCLAFTKRENASTSSTHGGQSCAVPWSFGGP